MERAKRAKYTLEFKQEAVRLVESGQTLAAAARSLGLVDQTLHNWVQAEWHGKLRGAEKKVVSAEQMEISRLRNAAEQMFAIPRSWFCLRRVCHRPKTTASSSPSKAHAMACLSCQCQSLSAANCLFSMLWKDRSD